MTDFTLETGPDGIVRLSRLWRGVTDVHEIDPAFLESAEARKLHRIAAEHADVYAAPVRLVRSTADEPVDDAEGDDADAESPLLADDAITLPTQLIFSNIKLESEWSGLMRYRDRCIQN